MIAVTGTGRSGTTFVTRVLAERTPVDVGAGADLDDQLEDPRLRGFLADLHAGKFDRSGEYDEAYPTRWMRHYLEERRREADPGAPDWAVKDPRLTDPGHVGLLRRAAGAVGEELRWAVAWRRPDDVVESWVRHFSTHEARARERVDARVDEIWQQIFRQRDEQPNEAMHDAVHAAAEGAPRNRALLMHMTEGGEEAVLLGMSDRRTRDEVVGALALLDGVQVDRGASAG